MSWQQLFNNHLAKLERAGNYRSLRVASPELCDFTSNDYLGLANHERVRAHLAEFIVNAPHLLCSTGSRLLRGHSEIYEETEALLAKQFRRESALIFNTGYMANLGVITALAKLGCTFFSDAENHASMVDGVRLARAPYQIYPHCDFQALNDQLAASTAEHKVILTESVFSMSGNFAPLSEITYLAEKYDALLVVDEAHATGIYGDTGFGCMEEFGDLDVVTIHTGGKAWASFGAFITCSAGLRQVLLNEARSLIYSTALPPYVLKHWQAALKILSEEPWRREQLLAHAEYLRGKLCLPAGSHIVPVPIPTNEAVLKAARTLEEKGFDVRPIRYPTVAAGTERLRVTLRATHTREEIDRLAATVQQLRATAISLG